MIEPSLAARRELMAVFLLVAGTSVLLTSGNIRSADYVVAFSVAGNLVESGSLQATPIENFESWAVGIGRDGRPYTRYGLGHSILGVPAQLAGRAIAGAWEGTTAFLDIPVVRFYSTEDTKAAWCGLFGVLTNSLVLGLLAVGVMALAGALGMSVLPAIVAALLASVGLMFQASDFTAEPASALALVLAALGMVRIERGELDWKGASALCFLTGLALGGAVLLKVAHGVLLLPAIPAFGLAWSRGRAAGRGISGWAAFATGIAMNLAVVVAYNQARFGSALETGYGAFATAFTNPFWEGALGQLFSPGRGLVFYFPAAVLAVFGVRRMWALSCSMTLMTFGALAALWVLYSPWFAWEGGWTYGPRLLSPALALMAIPATLVLFSLKTAAGKIVGRSAIALSCMASFLGFLVDYIDYGFYVWRTHGESTASAMRWDWDLAPILAYWTFPERRGTLVGQLFEPGLPWFLVLVFVASILAVVASAGVLLRRRK